jgi:carbon-monoxide dehydrogenase large subunit
VEAAIKDDGTILGLKYRLLCDAGAYFHWIGVVGGFNTLQHGLGCYRIPNVQAELSYVYTHNSTVAPYRGNGRPEGIFLLERTVDLVARELQMDPVEVRRKNLISRDSFPYKTPLGLTYDTGDYQSGLDKALEAVGYRALREEQRLGGDGPLLGVGICTYVESSAYGPSSASASGWESARVELHRSGEVTVHSGSSPHGQGDETPFAQIAAERLGVSIENVRVLHGDTDLMPEGVGTFGSRSLVVGGSAVYLAAEAVVKKALQVAAHNLSIEPHQVLFQAGRFLAQDGSERGLSIQEVANLAYSPVTMPPGTDLGLEASAYFQPQGLTFPFGTQIAVVEVEPDTGEVRIRRLVSVEDCGRMINPRLVEGQVHGGVAQGIGEALYEAVTFEEDGQLLTSSFMQYCFPTAEMLPAIETHHTVTPSPLNPLGAKGVGESGAIGAPAAVVNAVMDALSRWDIRHLDPPLTPEKVWQAIKGAGIPEPR